MIGGQLVRLALRSGPEIKVTLAEPLARSWSRPDIVDRNGRLLASDIAVNSLYADPYLILDRDASTLVDVGSGLAPGDVGDNAYLGGVDGLRESERRQRGHEGRDGASDRRSLSPDVHDLRKDRLDGRRP